MIGRRSRRRRDDVDRRVDPWVVLRARSRPDLRRPHPCRRCSFGSVVNNRAPTSAHMSSPLRMLVCGAARLESAVELPFHRRDLTIACRVSGAVHHVIRGEDERLHRIDQVHFSSSTETFVPSGATSCGPADRLLQVRIESPPEELGLRRAPPSTGTCDISAAWSCPAAHFPAPHQMLVVSPACGNSADVIRHRSSAVRSRHHVGNKSGAPAVCQRVDAEI